MYGGLFLPHLLRFLEMGRPGEAARPQNTMVLSMDSQESVRSLRISNSSSFIDIWLVVWKIFYFPKYWEQSSQLTNIFQRGSNHQPDILMIHDDICSYRKQKNFDVLLEAKLNFHTQQWAFATGHRNMGRSTPRKCLGIPHIFLVRLSSSHIS